MVLRRLPLVLPLVSCIASAAGLQHFDVLASFEPAKKASRDGIVTVSFRALDPDLRLNATPAPRLKLDLLQTVLVDKPSAEAARALSASSETKYLDLAKPVPFPVSIAPGAPKGAQQVKAAVVYFYCSQREGWCRRGTAEVEIPVDVR